MGDDEEDINELEEWYSCNKDIEYYEYKKENNEEDDDNRSEYEDVPSPTNCYDQEIEQPHLMRDIFNNALLKVNTERDKHFIYKMFIFFLERDHGACSPHVRENYEIAIKDLKNPALAQQLCQQYARSETIENNIENARKIYIYCSQYSSVVGDNVFWMNWENFEFTHGNEGTQNAMNEKRQNLTARKAIMPTEENPNLPKVLLPYEENNAEVSIVPISKITPESTDEATREWQAAALDQITSVTTSSLIDLSVQAAPQSTIYLNASKQIEIETAEKGQSHNVFVNSNQLELSEIINVDQPQVTDCFTTKLPQSSETFAIEQSKMSTLELDHFSINAGNLKLSISKLNIATNIELSESSITDHQSTVEVITTETSGNNITTKEQPESIIIADPFDANQTVNTDQSEQNVFICHQAAVKITTDTSPGNITAIMEQSELKTLGYHKAIKILANDPSNLFNVNFTEPLNETITANNESSELNRCVPHQATNLVGADLSVLNISNDNEPKIPQDISCNEATLISIDVSSRNNITFIDEQIKRPFLDFDVHLSRSKVGLTAIETSNANKITEYEKSESTKIDLDDHQATKIITNDLSDANKTVNKTISVDSKLPQIDSSMNVNQSESANKVNLTNLTASDDCDGHLETSKLVNHAVQSKAISSNDNTLSIVEDKPIIASASLNYFEQFENQTDNRYLRINSVPNNNQESIFRLAHCSQSAATSSLPFECTESMNEPSADSIFFAMKSDDYSTTGKNSYLETGIYDDGYVDGIQKMLKRQQSNEIIKLYRTISR